MTTGPVVVSGASGLIGRALVRSLVDDGIETIRLVRRPSRARDEVEWDPEEGKLDPTVLAGATAVVNLNGASIGRLPWTPRYRRKLLASRVAPTRTLASAIQALGSDAPHFVSASAVGFYGDRPGEILTERSGQGHTFLAELCRDWEAAALSAGTGADVALLRTAPLLHPQGVLKPLITLTRLGVSGPLGRGTQAWPWISLNDEVGAIRHIINHRMPGPINLSGPEIASANQIGRQLARRMRRPYLLRVPAWALRLALGRAADSLLLSDAAVTPAALLDSGYTFTHPTVEAALASVMSKTEG